MFFLTLYLNIILANAQHVNVLVEKIPYSSLSECLRAGNNYIPIVDGKGSSINYTSSCKEEK